MNELYRQNSMIVYHFLYSMCKDEALAEDLMQETFLQAFESIERFDGSCKVSTWLCQIAKHLLFHYWEKTKKECVMEPEEQPACDDTEKQAINRVELADVLDKLDKLSDDMKDVVYLRVLSDMSYKEIGEIFGKSESWARVTFFRAKTALLKATD